MITIRVATKKHIVAVAAMEADAHEYPWPAAEFVAFAFMLRNFIYVAVDGKELLGYCCFTVDRTDTEIEIINLTSCDDEATFALINEVEKHDLPIVVELLDTETEAMEVYRSLGFKAANIRRDVVIESGETRDVFTFRKDRTDETKNVRRRKV